MTPTPSSSEDARRWYVVHTKANQESRADSNLRAWQVETFSPLVRKRRVNQLTQQASYRVGPLFPRYIFARFDSQTLLAKVRFTRGVHGIVSAGDEPVPVDDGDVEHLRMKVGEDGYVSSEEKKLRRGDKVLIHAGPLQGLSGVFEENVGPSDRVRILLANLYYQARLVVGQHLIQQVPDGSSVTPRGAHRGH